MIDAEYDEKKGVWIGECEISGCNGKIISPRRLRKYCKDCTQQLHINPIKFYKNRRNENGRKEL